MKTHWSNGKRKRPSSKQAGKSALRRKVLKAEKDKLLDVETRHQLSLNEYLETVIEETDNDELQFGIAEKD